MTRRIPPRMILRKTSEKSLQTTLPKRAEKQHGFAVLLEVTEQFIPEKAVRSIKTPDPLCEITVPQSAQIEDPVLSAHFGKCAQGDAVSFAIAKYSLPDSETAAVVEPVLF